MKALRCGIGGIFALMCTAPPLAAQTPLVGALAVDERHGGQHGWALDHTTTVAARSAALRECGPGCSVVLTFERCGAFAADQVRGGTAAGWAASHISAATARHAALSECASRGGSKCIVLVWGCNSHVADSAPSGGGRQAAGGGRAANYLEGRSVESIRPPLTERLTGPPPEPSTPAAGDPVVARGQGLLQPSQHGAKSCQNNRRISGSV